MLDEQAALRGALDAAEARLRTALEREAGRGGELEAAQARLANVSAEEAGLRERVAALLQQKVRGEGARICWHWRAFHCAQAFSAGLVFPAP